MIELLLEAERALELGRVDAAETMFRQVADADPRNAIAVVGLARVAIERGDETGALALGRRALEIDPENAAAGRLVARLEEVIAYRGDEVPAAAGEGVGDAAAVDAPPSETRAAPIVPSAPADPALSAAPVPAAVPTPSPLADPAPASAATPSPTPPKRRSWLDRLLRRNR